MAEMKTEIITHKINNTHNLEEFYQLKKKHKIDLQVISWKVNNSCIRIQFG